MCTPLELAIQQLRTVAVSRSVLQRASASGRRRHSAGERRAARKENEAVLIREAQRVGALPALLVPILWKILYAVAWQAIQYWLTQLDPENPDPIPPEAT